MPVDETKPVKTADDCLEKNLCLENNGGCSKYAHCTMKEAGEVTCSCYDSFMGDGFNCIGLFKVLLIIMIQTYILKFQRLN